MAMLPTRVPNSGGDVRPRSDIRSSENSMAHLGEIKTIMVGKMPKEVLPPYYEAIGRMVATWADFEHIIDANIWDLAGVTPEIGSCITANLTSVLSRMRALVALAHIKGLKSDVIGAL